MTAGDATIPGQMVVCAQCGEPYQQAGRSNGGWFHFMVIAAQRQPDDRTRITGHWRAGDWIEGAPLIMHTRDGRRATLTGAEMEPPLSSACEARGQRALIVTEFSSFGVGGCIHAVR